jgi:hypothetical protein
MKRDRVPNTDTICDGGLNHLSRSARIALEYAADIIAQDHQTLNGKTCLFWALVGTATQHTKRVPPATVLPGEVTQKENT